MTAGVEGGATALRAERRRSLRLSVVDGVLHAVMLGAGESYFGALAVELGHRDVALALLVTVPLACGALSQLATPRLTGLFGGEKRLVVFGVFGQALAHLAFVAIAWTGSDALLPLVLAKSAYWVCASSHAPAWSAWMTRLVPARSRARFFAGRAWIYNVALLVSFLGTGLALDAWRDDGRILFGFGVVALVAMVARGLGGLAVTRQSPYGEPRDRPRARLSDVLRLGRWRVAIFVAVLLTGAQLAIPFFTPYMLEELDLDMSTFAFLTSLSIAAKGVSFPLWRRASTRFGPRAALAVSGALIAIVPALWATSPDLATLAFAQALGGVAWAGYELCSVELLMADAPKQATVEFYSLANPLSAVLQLAGSIAGGMLLRSEAVDYPTIFSISAVGRGAALVVLIAIPSPRRHVEALLGRAQSVRPGAGGVRAPVLAPADGTADGDTRPRAA